MAVVLTIVGLLLVVSLLGLSLGRLWMQGRRQLQILHQRLQTEAQIKAVTRATLAAMRAAARESRRQQMGP